MDDLFLLLLAGHLLGDWLVQTDWQALNKAKESGWASALLSHVFTYHLTMAVCVLPVWHTKGTAVAFAISWWSHAFIDRRWPVRWLLRKTGSPGFAEQTWGVIATDQALHLTILALIAVAAG